MDINTTTIIGRMTADPTTAEAGAAKLARFSLAVGYNYTTGGTKKEEVSYFNCEAWGKLGEVILKWCKKGNRVGVTGRLKQERWDDGGVKKSAIKIIARDVQFLTQKEGTQPAGEHEILPFGEEDAPF